MKLHFFRNQRDGLGNKLLIGLNACDLIICVVSTVNVSVFFSLLEPLTDFLHQLYFFMRGENPAFSPMNAYKFFVGLSESTLPYYSLLLLFILMSCFMTLLLSATRMISTLRPFLRMKRKLILLAGLVAASVFIALFVAKLQVMKCLRRFTQSQHPDLEELAGCAQRYEPVETNTLRAEGAIILVHIILVSVFSVLTALKLQAGDKALQQVIGV